MSWAQLQLTNLRRVLSPVYPREMDQRRIVREVELPEDMIPFDPSAANSWSAILMEASRRSKVDAIVALAVDEHPENELLRRAREAEPPAVINGPEVPWRGPARADALIERLTGKRSTLVPIGYLERGLRRARSVAKVRCQNGSSGSGFLIAGDVLVTNHHVMPDAATAFLAPAHFNYQQTAEGADEPVDKREFDPAAFFMTSPADDWTAVAVKGAPTKQWGAIELRCAPVEKDDVVNIVQHPGGGYKQISVAPNVVAFVGGGRVQYLTDTLPGSSGSPVFDDQWNLIGLHHSGGWITEPGVLSKQTYYRNEGILIDVLVGGLAQEPRYAARVATPRL